jgi:hypothetical protein
MRFKNISASLLALSLGIVSTTFVFISITSKEWSVQKYYSSNGGRGSTTTWTDPVCVAHRSPFYRCMNWPIISYDAVANTTSCSIADCSFYKPYGFDQTSCRSAVEVGDENGVTVGGFQECQQGKKNLTSFSGIALIQAPPSSPRWKPASCGFSFHSIWLTLAAHFDFPQLHCCNLRGRIS